MTTTENPQSDHNVPVFSVAEISFALKKVVEGTFSYIRVRGEISGFKKHTSGHSYLTLKDADAAINAVMWRGTRSSIPLEDGLEVICTGRLSTYPARSNYQLVIESVELAGQGALLKLLEERRKKLLAEGLFDPATKKPLPYLPQVIGVITSQTGAVIRDIMHRLNDRFPTRVLLWPCNVQGDGAAEQVSAAIKGFNNIKAGGVIPRPDLIIVARGGGSLEDLMPFNEEIVVRAAAASDIPLISAVGHETDTTLIDYAADVRAPTPTAAAEMAVPVRAELVAGVLDLQQRLLQGLARLVEVSKSHLSQLIRHLRSVRHYIDQYAQKFDHLHDRFAASLKSLAQTKTHQFAFLTSKLLSPKNLIAQSKQRLQTETRSLKNVLKPILNTNIQHLAQLQRLMDSLSFQRVLDRGFALIQSKDGKLLTTTAAVKAEDTITIRLKDGEVKAAPKKV